jgi:hypothetical protein
MFSPIGEKKLFSEKGCFSRKCYLEKTFNDKPNDNDLVFHLVISTATYSNPDHPSLTGPEFSSDVTGDGHPKKIRMISDMPVQSIVAIDSNEVELELAPAHGNGGVSLFTLFPEYHLVITGENRRAHKNGNLSEHFATALNGVRYTTCTKTVKEVMNQKSAVCLHQVGLKWNHTKAFSNVKGSVEVTLQAMMNLLRYAIKRLRMVLNS